MNVPIDLNFAMVAPLIVVTAGVLIVLILDLLLPHEHGRPWWFGGALGGLLLAGWYSLGLWPEAGVSQTTLFGSYATDRFSLFFGGIILLTGVLTVFLSAAWREMREVPDTRHDASGYLSLVMLASLGMLVLAGAGNLIMVFMGLEILSLSLYVLVGFGRENLAGREGALKYFVLGSAASGFLIYGFALIYGATGTINLAEIAAHWQTAGTEVSGLFKAGVALALVGFSFKLALVPFHAWAPDAYQGAPAPITAFMAVGTKAAAFAALVRFLVAAAPPGAEFQYLVPLGVLAVLSMLVGSLGALPQDNLKRLLAYSAIAHAGYLFVALPGLTDQGIGAGAFYLLAYAFMNMGVFAVILWMSQGDDDGDQLETYAGLFYRKPWLAGVLTLFMLSMAGLPPTGGFTGKLLLILAAVNVGAWWLIAFLVGTTAISAYVYLRVVSTLFRRSAAPAAAVQLAQSEAAAVAEAGAPVGDDRVGAVSLHHAAQTTSHRAADHDVGQNDEDNFVPLQPVPQSAALALGAVLIVTVLGTLYMGLAPQSILSLTEGLLPLP